MFSAFQERPGLLFVAATLLPLAAFALLLIAGGIRNFLRPFKKTEPWGGLFELFGGEVTGRGPAFVGLGAIVLAFLLSFSGFCLYLGEYDALGKKQHELNEKIEPLSAKSHGPKATPDERKELERLRGELADAQADFADRWENKIVWAAVHPAHIADKDFGTELTVGYRIDSLSATMFVMVTFVASLIFLFSIGYMKEELQLVVEDHEVHADDGGHYKRRGRFGRFFLFLSLFSFSMLNLLLADNLFQIFVSWELVGICSFLLVGYYFERQSASNAANKAFITNRVGDAGFIIGLMIVWTFIGTFNFEEIFKRVRGPLADMHEPLSNGGQFVRAKVDPSDKSGITYEITPRGTGDYVVIHALAIP